MNKGSVPFISFQTGDAARLQQFQVLAGLTGSFSEHAVFEAIHGFDSVSAVKAIQASAAQGVPIFKIDASNASQLIPQLQLPADNVQEIQDGISVGLVAIVPQREITLNDWTGTGYIIKNPITSAGLYRIAGGLAGGSTTKNGDGATIAQMFRDSLFWLKASMDSLARGTIKLAAELMAAEGSTIADNQTIADKANAKLGTPYLDPGVYQCSGLVRYAYSAAGICLDGLTTIGSLPQCAADNLAARYGISGPNGVNIHYQLANTLALNQSVRMTNDPLIGDIVFFKNTDGSGARYTHEGIVVSTPTADGTVRFIHSTRRLGVHNSRMNIVGVLANPEVPIDFLGTFCPQGQGIPRCLAGSPEIFDGYGTIRDPRTLPQ